MRAWWRGGVEEVIGASVRIKDGGRYLVDKKNRMAR
jgi:hypothetical protein